MAFACRSFKPPLPWSMRNRALAPRLHPHRRVQFCEHDEVTDADVVGLVRAISDRVLRLLRRLGKWPAVGEAAAAVADGDATDLMLELGAAAVQGRTALGERAGAMDARVGRGTRREPLVKGPLCADVDGFSLHAAVRGWSTCAGTQGDPPSRRADCRCCGTGGFCIR